MGFPKGTLPNIILHALNLRECEVGSGRVSNRDKEESKDGSATFMDDEKASMLGWCDLMCVVRISV